MLCSAASALERSTPTAPLPALSAYTRHSEDSFLVKNQSPCFKDGPNSGRVSRGTGSFFTCAVFEVQMSTQASLCDPNPPEKPWRQRCSACSPVASSRGELSVGECRLPRRGSEVDANWGRQRADEMCSHYRVLLGGFGLSSPKLQLSLT